jgi:hypothetical protein
MVMGVGESGITTSGRGPGGGLGNIKNVPASVPGWLRRDYVGRRSESWGREEVPRGGIGLPEAGGPLLELGRNGRREQAGRESFEAPTRRGWIEDFV